jgi:hypothetical protein
MFSISVGRSILNTVNRGCNGKENIRIKDDRGTWYFLCPRSLNVVHVKTFTRTCPRSFLPLLSEAMLFSGRALNILGSLYIADTNLAVVTIPIWSRGLWLPRGNLPNPTRLKHVGREFPVEGGLRLSVRVRLPSFIWALGLVSGRGYASSVSLMHFGNNRIEDEAIELSKRF